MAKFFIFTVVIFAAIFESTNAGLKPKGGLGASKPVDSEVTALVERLKPGIITKICEGGATCPTADSKFVINSYRTQTVSGTNYFVALNIEDITYHARLYSQPWTNTEQVHSVQGPKQLADEITYF